MEEFLDLAEENIFISKELMELLREKLVTKKAFLLRFIRLRVIEKIIDIGQKLF